MIKPVLKDIDIVGIPPSTDDFVVGATAYIGVDEITEGADCFYFRIMTPKKIMSMLDEGKVINGRATLLVNDFDLDLIKKEINKILNDCARDTWDEAAKAINRYLKWEYDNIQYETLEEAVARLNKINNF